VLPSSPQFITLGPLFHCLKETNIPRVISYPSSTINAQMAYNHAQELVGGGAEVPLVSAWIPWGPGVILLCLRNALAMCGIRLLSGPVQQTMRRLRVPESFRGLLSDFIASIGSGCLTTPLNQLYNYSSTSQAYTHSGSLEQLRQLAAFLGTTYVSCGPAGEILGLRQSLVRDLMLRSLYTAAIFTLFGAIERICVLLWRLREKRL